MKNEAQNRLWKTKPISAGLDSGGNGSAAGCRNTHPLRAGRGEIV